jgi:antitoxin component YwqK of YwqJK toxin-antitoxin module
MHEAPPRPDAVPRAAEWSDELGGWQLGGRRDGELDGPQRVWRRDGSLALECAYDRGKRVGPFRRFHPNGELAREGVYADGSLDGVVVAHASSDGGGEPLRGCCVPPGAARMRASYESGRLVREVFFDGQDRPLCADGSLRPARPNGVPATAEFEEYGRRWREGRYDAARGICAGTWRWWDSEGRLVEEASYDADGRKALRRRWDETGALSEETALGDQEVPHGPHVSRWSESHERGHQDRRVRGAAGAFDRGHVVGRWRLLDAEGATLREVDVGTRFDDAAIETSEAFADRDASAPAWDELGVALARADRVREAVVAWARAAAVARSSAPLADRLGDRVPPLLAERAEELAQEVTNDRAASDLATLLDGLLRGADAASILRVIAARLSGRPRTSRDLVEAALLLAPERVDAFATRALVRLDLGDREGALADADRVGALSSGTAEFLREYARVSFPRFDFWPAREALPELPEELPVQPSQPLEAVRWAIALYATRLERVRARLAATTSDGSPPAWAPPDLSAVLPGGPVELRQTEATIEDEGADGTTELTTVAIDESLSVDGATVPVLMRLARASWTALTWLCWSVGLDAVAQPTELAPRAEYPRALAMALTRAFRAHDAIVTNGLRSMTQGVPGFAWEGLDVDELPRTFAQMAADEYLELRAVLLWLSNPGNVSPFQDDLRRL